MNKVVFEKTERFPNGYVIPADTEISAAEGSSVTMTVNGAVTAIQPGEYSGEVVFTVTEGIPSFGKVMFPNFRKGGELEKVNYEHEYKAALYVDVDDTGNTVVVPDKSVTEALQGCEFDNAHLKGGKFENHEEYFNGILIADGKYRISDIEMDYDANGGDDFELYGAAIAVGGNAEVVIDNVNIHTHGSIATTVAAGEKSTVLVENSVLKTEGKDEREYRDNCMTEVPWVLGLQGTVRSSNVVGMADVTIYNCEGESNGWGVFSTDDALDVHHRMVNTSAKISKDSKYRSGYGNYVLGGSHSVFLGVDYDIATYGVILTGASKEIHVGPSSKVNLEKFVGTDSLLYRETDGFKTVEEKNSVIRAGRSAFMWHGSEGSDNVFYVEPGTQLITGGPTFLVKAQGGRMPNGVEVTGMHPHISVSGAVVENGGTLLHYMESDDKGMGKFGFDGHWAEYYEVPEITLNKFEGHDLSNPDETGSMTFDMHDMTVSGDIFNTVYRTPQNLVVNMENVNYSGAAATGIQFHRNYKPGERIYIKDALEIGNVGVNPVGDHCNGLIMNLTAGSVWTVTGESFISALNIAEGCSVAAPVGKKLTMTVNGVPTEPACGSFRGDIRITVA